MSSILQKYPIFGQFTRTHPPEKLIAFASQLKYFYLYGYYISGHVELYEEVQCRITYTNREDFYQKITKLIDPIPIEDSSKMNIYPLPSPMETLPEFLDPGKTNIKDLPLKDTFVYINEGDGFFTISLHGDGTQDPWGITESTIQSANRLEKHLEYLGLIDSVVHSIASHFNCISRQNFPEAFD